VKNKKDRDSEEVPEGLVAHRYQMRVEDSGA